MADFLRKYAKRGEYRSCLRDYISVVSRNSGHISEMCRDILTPRKLDLDATRRLVDEIELLKEESVKILNLVNKLDGATKEVM